MWVCSRCSRRFESYDEYRAHEEYCDREDPDERVDPRVVADGGILRLPRRLGDDAIGPNKGCFNANSSLINAGGVRESVSLEINPDTQFGVIDLGLTWDDDDVDVYLSIDLDAEEARELAGVLERCAFAVEEVADDE